MDCEHDLYSIPLQGSELESYVLKHCTVFSLPPVNLNVEPFVCHSKTIKNCNETGLWDYNMLGVDSLCFGLRGMSGLLTVTVF